LKAIGDDTNVPVSDPELDSAMLTSRESLAFDLKTRTYERRRRRKKRSTDGRRNKAGGLTSLGPKLLGSFSCFRRARLGMGIVPKYRESSMAEGYRGRRR
jgi:hypothetical protein